MRKDKSELVEKAHAELDKRFNRAVGVSASNLCVRCGLCVDACHYVQGDEKDLSLSPVAKAERIRSVYKGRHDWLSKVFPWWTGAKKLTEEELQKWVEVAYKNCTMCQRCTVNCPLGVDVPEIIGAARSTLTELGLGPEMLDMLANASIAREDNLDMFKEIFAEQIQVMEKQLREIMGNEKATIPMDVKGAKYLYVPLSGAHTMLPAAAIFNAAEESWTMSMFEASNYGVFLKDTPRAKQIADRIVKEAIRLGVEEVIITECGHAYATFRWTAPSWYDKPWPFKVRSIIEVIDEYIQHDRIKLDPTRIKDAVTLHDSCNLGRNSGLFEEPRRIIHALAQDYREMTPNREQNYCCGGGAGLVAVPEWQETRMKSGKPKAEQVKNTGAKIVVASCDNCRHQIDELSTEYGLEVKVSGLSELVLEALVL